MFFLVFNGKNDHHPAPGLSKQNRSSPLRRLYLALLVKEIRYIPQSCHDRTCFGFETSFQRASAWNTNHSSQQEQLNYKWSRATSIVEIKFKIQIKFGSVMKCDFYNEKMCIIILTMCSERIQKETRNAHKFIIGKIMTIHTEIKTLPSKSKHTPYIGGITVPSIYLHLSLFTFEDASTSFVNCSCVWSLACIVKWLIKCHKI